VKGNALAAGKGSASDCAEGGNAKRDRQQNSAPCAAFGRVRGGLLVEHLPTNYVLFVSYWSLLRILVSKFPSLEHCFIYDFHQVILP
jgi:hypothetical protein